MSSIDIKKLREMNLLGREIGDISEPAPTPTSTPMGMNSNYQEQMYDAPSQRGGYMEESYETPPSPPPRVEAPQFSPQKSIEEIMDLINKGYTPSTRASDRYNSHIDNIPQRSEASFARKLVAGGMGLGSKDPLGTMDHVLNAPYLEDMADWKERTQPFGQAAQYENTANTNERNLMGNVITGKIALDRQMEASRIADAKNETTRLKNEAQAESARIRSRAYAYSTRLGNKWVWDLSGPTAKKMHKDTGEVIDTGLETGKMDEETKIELQNEGRVAAAEASGAAAIDRARAMGSGVIQIEGKTYAPDPDNPNKYVEIGGLPPGLATRPGTPRAGAVEDPKDTAIRKQQRWREIYDNYGPARKWMVEAPDGSLSLKPPPVAGAGEWNPFKTNQSQEDVIEYNELRKILYPDIQSQSSSSQQQPQLQEEEPLPPPLPLEPPKQTSRSRTDPTTTIGGRQRYLQPSGSSAPSANTTTGGRQRFLQSDVKTQTDSENPNHKRRTSNGGRTWEESFDGGKTWSK